MSDRAAQAAAQSDPWRNWNFSRGWGQECGVGDPVAEIRSWHADAEPLDFTSLEKQRAERRWQRITRGVRP